MPRLTQVAHQQLTDAIHKGDFAIDATAGNGHDTLFLAQCVGENGQVLAIDRQASALAKTAERLTSAGVQERVTLAENNHAELLAITPENWQGQVAAIAFNLGYLPGSDKSVITTANSTHAALDACLPLLKPGGLLSILIYRGHAGGHEEEAMIHLWLQSNESAFSQIEWNDGDFPTESSPRLLSCLK